MTYNGKPSSKELPEFDFDNLPESITGKPKPEPKREGQSTYTRFDAPPVDAEPTQPLVATGADGNRSASLFSKDRTFDFQQHDWVQHGRELVCTTCPENHRHGSVIGTNQQLTGSRGNWQIVPNGGRCYHGNVKVLCDKCADQMVKANSPKNIS